MSVTIHELSAISRTVALEHGRALQVSGVTLSDGGNDRVEVIVSINGCHDGECRFVVNVTRADGDAFEREFRSKLHDAIRKHQLV
jgi:hypothetical protein